MQWAALVIAKSPPSARPASLPLFWQVRGMPAAACRLPFAACLKEPDCGRDPAKALQGARGRSNYPASHALTMRCRLSDQANPAYRGVDNHLALGMYAFGSDRLVEVATCLLATSEINAVLAILREKFFPAEPGKGIISPPKRW